MVLISYKTNSEDHSVSSSHLSILSDGHSYHSLVFARGLEDSGGKVVEWFAEPHEEQMSFSEFLDLLESTRNRSPAEIPYMQVTLIR